MKKTKEFDITLAKDCAKAFATTSQLGTVVSYANGQILASFGAYHCGNCGLCHVMGEEQAVCVSSRIRGMNESERLGGKYVYFCPMGLTCFTSPIMGSIGVAAKITVGPFLMEEPGEYVYDDLLSRLPGGVSPEELARELSKVPYVSAARVEDMSHLMFLSASFLNNFHVSSHMLDIQELYSIQKQMSSYTTTLRGGAGQLAYPIFVENELLECIAHGDRDGASRHLNALLGYILFTLGTDVQQAKSRVYELLILISRRAITSGADAQMMLTLTHNYMQTIPRLADMDELCAWLAKAVNRFMEILFEYTPTKHAKVIYNAIQYIRDHYSEAISLQSVAQAVFLSPTYFSRVFRRETGETFKAYLNTVRVEQSKRLLTDQSIRLVDVALMSGFESQSYYTKVFKKKTGLSPLQYREKICSRYWPEPI